MARRGWGDAIQARNVDLKNALSDSRDYPQTRNATRLI